MSQVSASDRHIAQWFVNEQRQNVDHLKFMFNFAFVSLSLFSMLFMYLMVSFLIMNFTIPIDQEYGHDSARACFMIFGMALCAFWIYFALIPLQAVDELPHTLKTLQKIPAALQAMHILKRAVDSNHIVPVVLNENKLPLYVVISFYVCSAGIFIILGLINHLLERLPLKMRAALLEWSGILPKTNDTKVQRKVEIHDVKKIDTSGYSLFLEELKRKADPAEDMERLVERSEMMWCSLSEHQREFFHRKVRRKLHLMTLKKSPSGYACFVKHLRDQSNGTTSTSAGSLVKQAEEQWIKMTEEERKPFNALAQAKKKYLRDMKEYKMKFTTIPVIFKKNPSTLASANEVLPENVPSSSNATDLPKSKNDDRVVPAETPSASTTAEAMLENPVTSSPQVSNIVPVVHSSVVIVEPTLTKSDQQTLVATQKSLIEETIVDEIYKMSAHRTSVPYCKNDLYDAVMTKLALLEMEHPHVFEGVSAESSGTK
jgi:hypothetical protein